MRGGGEGRGTFFGQEGLVFAQGGRTQMGPVPSFTAGDSEASRAAPASLAQPGSG